MVVSPQSIFKLIKGIPYTNTGEHTILFASREAQLLYMESKVVRTFTDFTYVKQSGKVRVPVQREAIADCNYCMFKNLGFGEKWFFAFITQIDYLNTETAEITLDLDHFQTWHFEMSIGKCFVERENVADDSKGKHTIPEGLEHGDFIVTSMKEWVSTVGQMLYVLPSDVGAVDPESTRVNNVFTPLMVLVSGAGGEGALMDFLSHYDKDPEKIPVIMTAPSICAGESYGAGHPHEVVETIRVSPPETIDGYTPENNKLFTYPYCYVAVDNMAGSCGEFKFELAGEEEVVENVSRETLEPDTPTLYNELDDEPEPVETAGNFYLTKAQMQDNAKIWYQLCTAGNAPFDDLAIYAMLGNAQKESSVNPAIYQDLDSASDSNGYGLFQWTPNTKYFQYCTDNQLDPATLATARMRITYENTHSGTQWIPTQAYPISMNDFLYNTGGWTLDYLVSAWLYNYERPKSYATYGTRLQYAKEWQEFLTGYTPDPEPVQPDPDPTPVSYGRLTFSGTAGVVPKPIMFTYPLNYKGIGADYEDGVVYDNFIVCPWVNDTFGSWLSFNGGTMLAKTGASIAGAGIAGFKVAGIKGAIASIGVSGLLSIYDNMKQVEYHQLHNTQMNGGIGGATALTMVNKVGFRYKTVTIKAEYARIIDQYFTRYGYQVNSYKVPELTSRETFNFVKTSECVVLGDIPETSRQKIKSMFDNGVTLWHTAEVGNYSVSNAIRERTV